jgi:hypothetical protein
MLNPSPMVPSKDVHGTGQLEGSNPPDKPLPSLPIATIQGRSPIVRRSLIDAREKPLRRSISPSPGEKIEEEWPALSPSRTTTPNSCQKTDQMDNEGEEASSQTPSLRPESQAVDVLAVPLTANNQSRLVSASKVDELQLRGKPCSSLLDAKESAPMSTNRDIPSEGASLDIVRGKESNSGAVPPTSNFDFSPTLQATPFSQISVKLRVSRLPKRLSGPGPVRNSGSPRRTLSGLSSPYDSSAARIFRDPSIRQGHGLSGAKKPVERGKSNRVDHAAYGANPVSVNGSSSLAVKQSSKHGQGEDGKSSIPRPRHQYHLHHDGESEADIVISKLSRKKLFSNRRENNYDSDDGDLDTDEGYKEKEENAIPRDFNSSKADKKPSEGLDNEGAEMEHFEAAAAGVAEEKVSPAVGRGFTSTSDNHQVNKSSTADPDSVLDTHLNSGHQRPLLEKPFDRVKRLSATAPEHGPVLRISDSAEKIIMGYGSEDEIVDNELPARKRNSVPDIRRSVMVKELRKSTEGLLNGHLPLARSSTTGSFSKTEFTDQAGEAWDGRRNSDSCSELHSVVAKATTQSSEDPFSASNGLGTSHKHKIPRKPSPHARLDWPLKSPPPTSTELHPVREDSCEESASWISPFQSPLATNVSEPKSTSRSDAQESRLMATCPSGSPSKRPILQDTSSLASGNKSPGMKTRDHSAAHTNVPFPPRTSSRTNTPDVSLRPRLQVHHPSSREIPNRFDSAHPRRLSEDFSVPKGMAVEPDTLRNSVHDLKGGEKPRMSTPAAREMSKVQLSTAKGMFSNIKGLFHKRSIETPTPSSMTKSKVPHPSDRHGTVAINGSPYPNYHSRTLPGSYGAHKATRPGISIVPTARDAFPKSAATREPPSPAPDSDDYRQATDLAMRILDAAQTEDDVPKRARLVQVSFPAPTTTK